MQTIYKCSTKNWRIPLITVFGMLILLEVTSWCTSGTCDERFRSITLESRQNLHFQLTKSLPTVERIALFLFLRGRLKGIVSLVSMFGLCVLWTILATTRWFFLFFSASRLGSRWAWTGLRRSTFTTAWRITSRFCCFYQSCQPR